MSSDDINIVIGAKDNASRVLSQVAEQTRRVSAATNRMADNATGAGRRFTAAIAGMINPLKSLVAGYLTIQGVRGFITFLSDSAKAADEAAEAERALGKAIELTGSSIGPTVEQHKQLAASLQKLIGLDGDAVVALMKQASMLGINNENLQNSTKAAIGLSEALGMDVETALQKVALAIHGNANAFAKQIPGLKNAQNEEEKLAIIQQMAAKGLAQKSDRAATAIGAGDRLTAAWGDFRETIGALMEPMRMFTYGALVPLVETINTSLIPAVQSMTLPLNAVKLAFHGLRVQVTSFVTSFELIATNLGTIWDIVSMRFTLALVGMKEDAEHTLTVAIPAYVEWFYNNSWTMLENLVKAYKTAFSNIAISVGEIVDAMWDSLIEGGEANAVKLSKAISRAMSRGLTEGLNTKQIKLPEIEPRTLTGWELGLMRDIGLLAGGLATTFATKMAERLRDEAAELGVDPLVQEEKGASDKKKKSDEFIKEIQAKQSRLLTRGPARDLQKDMLDEAKRQTKKLDKIEQNTYPEHRSLTNALELTKVSL